jgi:DNA repair protein RadC
LTNTQAAANYLRQFYTGDIDIFESSFILLLNNSMQTIGFAKISQGGITGTVIDPRIVAHYAVKCLATAVIIAHNHPSGNLNPSESDKKVTEKIHKGLSLLDIDLIDHIIFSTLLNSKFWGASLPFFIPSFGYLIYFDLYLNPRTRLNMIISTHFPTLTDSFTTLILLILYWFIIAPTTAKLTPLQLCK